MKARTMGEAVLLLAGLRALSQGAPVLTKLKLKPHADGQSVIMVAGSHFVIAPLPPGVSYDEMMNGEIDWFDPASPLMDMASEGNA